jgi:hypothetical protein
MTTYRGTCNPQVSCMGYFAVDPLFAGLRDGDVSGQKRTVVGKSVVPEYSPKKGS